MMPTRFLQATQSCSEPSNVEAQHAEHVMDSNVADDSLHGFGASLLAYNPCAMTERIVLLLLDHIGVYTIAELDT
jgi:hypothetical protein